MAHAKAYIAVTAPTVNSYKRLKVGDPRSGATWAPVYVSYAYNNRTQMLRVPAPGRVEDRTVDGSCNPYLAATVLLAAGLDGIERELDPGDPNTLNLYESTPEQRAELGIDTLPENLLDATRELERDDVIRRALGTTRERRLRRLLRRVQAARGAGRARADHGVGAQPLPPALLAMCGIVGLFAKSPDVELRLGALLGEMLAQLADRGPDSAGIALYREPAALGSTKLSLFSADPDEDWAALGDATVHASHAVVELEGTADAAAERIRSEFPHLRVMSAGDRIEIFKEAGDPRDVRRALRAAVDVGLARARAHADGDREPRDDRGRAPVLDRPRPVPRAQRLALEPQPPAADAAARGDRVPDRERHRGRGRLPGVAAARGRHAAGGARALPRRARRLLHVRGRDGRRLRGAARPDRVQAGGDGGERRLGRDGVGVPRDRRAAGRRRRRGVGAGAGARLLLGAGEGR